MDTKIKSKIIALFFLFTVFLLCYNFAYGSDLSKIKARGEIRHLGVPYANFVTGAGDGFSVDLIKLFAKYLGVKYVFVKSNWKHIISDLIGKKIVFKGNKVIVRGKCKIKGDIIASGLTVLPWRKKLVDYSSPTFPTQIWLIVQSESRIRPIIPSGDLSKDIKAVMSRLTGLTILSIPGTCLDASLYGIAKYGARIKNFNKNLNELAPAVINGQADATLLDVPDALIALSKFPGLIKIIGPISPRQVMGCAFRKTSPELRTEFNNFLKKIKINGTYIKLIQKYYPSVLDYYPDFFK